MVTTAVKPVFDSYENKDVFRVNVDKGTMEINIYQEHCKNQGKANVPGYREDPRCVIWDAILSR